MTGVQTCALPICFPVTISNSTGIWANQANFDHNSLTNYSSDQHIAHSDVSITAGNGLTGGGTIASSRTIDVGAGNGITVSADAVAAAGANGISVTAAGINVLVGNSQLISNATGIWANQANFDHNSLTNYVADRHIAHSGVSITAGNGLTGGGTIDASRTIDVAAGNGISVSADAVAVLGNTGLVVNTSGIHVNSDFISSNVQTFTTSGTWTKPSKGTVAYIQAWGAGGSGAKGTTSGSKRRR